MHEASARDDYMVIMPVTDSFVVYHMVKNPDRERLRIQDFQSAAERGRNRLSHEDAADYYAISCWDDFQWAKANRPAGNFRGIATLEVDGHRGCVYAHTFEPHHVSVWGTAEVLRESILQVDPADP
jgi:hypothetical protein